MVAPAPADAPVAVMATAIVMAVAIVMILANANMHTGANAADMGADTDVGASRRGAQHGQCKDRSDEHFHGTFPFFEVKLIGLFA
jgi:hypothetical protein